jgi:simple sugar transport system ATP-binding protein
LFELCDGLHVMAQGRLSPRIDRDQADVALIGSWMSGLWPEPASAAAGGGA